MEASDDFAESEPVATLKGSWSITNKYIILTKDHYSCNLEYEKTHDIH